MDVRLLKSYLMASKKFQNARVFRILDELFSIYSIPKTKSVRDGTGNVAWSQGGGN